MEIHFNSHTREGVTAGIWAGQGGFLHFNSHTREGVTSCFSLDSLRNSYFNSHTREGVTLLGIARTQQALNFNSHTREGVTLKRVQKLLNHSSDFNSHTREGVTGGGRGGHWPAQFQLTHPWGCDEYPNSHVHYGLISTHTPVRVWPHPFRCL